MPGWFVSHGHMFSPKVVYLNQTTADWAHIDPFHVISSTSIVSTRQTQDGITVGFHLHHFRFCAICEYSVITTALVTVCCPIIHSSNFYWDSKRCRTGAGVLNDVSFEGWKQNRRKFNPCIFDEIDRNKLLSILKPLFMVK